MTNTTADKLYYIESITDNFEHGGKAHNGLPIRWYAHRDTCIIPYPEGIRNYDKMDESDKGYSEWSLNELFTEEEVDMFMDFLNKEYPFLKDTKKCLIELPLCGNTLPIGAIASGGHDGVIVLPASPIGCEVNGYYDTRNEDTGEDTNESVIEEWLV